MVKNLDGKVVDVLSRREIRTNVGIIRIASWFYEQHEDRFEKLKTSNIEHSTPNAVLLVSKNVELWVPKKAIEAMR